MRNSLLIYFILIHSLFLFSQETTFQDLDLLSRLDYISEKIEEKNTDFIEDIYGFDKSDPDYESLIEVLVEKAGDLVFQEEYDYAFRIIEGVLYNNLAHVQAQELYLILDEILKEKAKAREEEERQRLEAEAEQERLRMEAAAEEERLRIAEEERLLEEAREEEERLLREEEERLFREEEEAIRREEEAARFAAEQAREAEYEAAIGEQQQLIDEAAAYEASIKDLGMKNLSFYAFLFPAEFLFYNSEVNTLYNSGTTSENMLYGVSAQFGINFIHPLILVNFDIDLDYGFIPISSNESQNLNFNTSASVTSPALFIPVSFRLGFFYNRYFYRDETATNMAITKFPTPSLGIGLCNFTVFDKLKLNLSFDYYLVSFLAQNLDSAFGGNISVSYQIASFNKFNLTTAVSTQALFLREAGMYETNVNGKLGIGISFNE